MCRFWIFLFFIISLSAIADDEGVHVDDILKSTTENFKDKKSAIKDTDNFELISSLSGKIKDDYLSHLVQYEKYLDAQSYITKQKSDTYNLSVFYWQRLSTKIIFWTVISLVLLGAILSVIQFYKSYKIVSRSETELSISDKGFTIKTSVLGLVMLLLSLAFFYFYIAFVYPISVVPLN